ILIFESTILLVQDLEMRYGSASGKSLNPSATLVASSSLARRYSLLLSHDSHYSATFWLEFVRRPWAPLFSWLRNAWMMLLLDSTLVDLDYFADKDKR